MINWHVVFVFILWANLYLRKHVIYHDIVQETKFKHTMKSFRRIETFLLRNVVAWLALSSLFWAEMSSARSLFSYYPI